MLNFLRVFPQCIETESDNRNAVEGGKSCFSKRNGITIQLIWTHMRSCSFWLPVQTLADFNQKWLNFCMSSNLLRYYLWTVSPCESQSHTSQTLDRCELKCMLEVTELHPNSIALCETTCLHTAAQLNTETPESPKH